MHVGAFVLTTPALGDDASPHERDGVHLVSLTVHGHPRSTDERPQIRVELSVSDVGACLATTLGMNEGRTPRSGEASTGRRDRARHARAIVLAFVAAAGSAACSSSGGGADPATLSPIDRPTPGDAAADGNTGARPDAGSGASLADRLARLTSTCTVASKGKFSIHDGGPETIDICQLNGAFFWTSSMNVDCDGKETTACNGTTDPAYQSTTSFPQSDGAPLVASELPYVVIPLPSSRFDYRASDIRAGAVVIVMYNGAVAFGVFGDEGPSNLLGEASYAMAKALGIDPDPLTGGVAHGVTYVVITGASAVVSPIEQSAAAAAQGRALAEKLLQGN